MHQGLTHWNYIFSNNVYRMVFKLCFRQLLPLESLVTQVSVSHQFISLLRFLLGKMLMVWRPHSKVDYYLKKFQQDSSLDLQGFSECSSNTTPEKNSLPFFLHLEYVFSVSCFLDIGVTCTLFIEVVCTAGRYRLDFDCFN